jgi:hypothetical protein
LTTVESRNTIPEPRITAVMVHALLTVGVPFGAPAISLITGHSTSNGQPSFL